MSPALVCGDCGQPYRPLAGHCRGGRYGGCCKSWATQRGHDAHRTGDFDDGSRRCLTTGEMLDAGWRQDPDGYWATPRDVADRERIARNMPHGWGERVPRSPGPGGVDPSATPEEIR